MMKKIPNPQTSSDWAVADAQTYPLILTKLHSFIVFLHHFSQVTDSVLKVLNRTKTMSQLTTIGFCSDCFKGFLRGKSLKYPIVQHISCLVPNNMYKLPYVSLTRMKSLIHRLIHVKHLPMARKSTRLFILDERKLTRTNDSGDRFP